MKGKTQGLPEAGPDSARHSPGMGLGVVEESVSVIIVEMLDKTQEERSSLSPDYEAGRRPVVF